MVDQAREIKITGSEILYEKLIDMGDGTYAVKVVTTSPDGSNSALGAKTDAVATDDTGTFSLIALFKRSLQRLTSLLTSQSVSASVIQFLAIGAASARSSAVNAATNRVVLTTNTNCWIALGSNPTASKATGSFFLAAGAQSYPIAVTGGTTKIAVLQDSSAGSLSIIESI